MESLVREFRALNRDLLTTIDTFHPHQWETVIQTTGVTLRRLVRDAIVAMMLTEARLHQIAVALDGDAVLDLGDLQSTPRVAEHAGLTTEALVIRLWHASTGVIGLLLSLPAERLRQPLRIDGRAVLVRDYLEVHVLPHLRDHLEAVRGALRAAA